MLNVSMLVRTPCEYRTLQMPYKVQLMVFFFPILTRNEKKKTFESIRSNMAAAWLSMLSCLRYESCFYEIRIKTTNFSAIVEYKFVENNDDDDDGNQPTNQTPHSYKTSHHFILLRSNAINTLSVPCDDHHTFQFCRSTLIFSVIQLVQIHAQHQGSKQQTISLTMATTLRIHTPEHVPRTHVYISLFSYEWAVLFPCR